MSRQTRWGILLFTLMGLAFLVAVEAGGLCQVEALTLDSQAVDSLLDNFAIASGGVVVNPERDRLIADLLERSDVFRVSLRRRLSGSIDVATNDFRVVCFLLDRSRGTLKGVTSDARVVNLKKDIDDWQAPIITGLNAPKPYERCDDPRVAVIVSHLERLREENREFHGLIDQVDLSRGDYVTVLLTGLHYRVLVRAECFRGDLNRFIEFVTRYEPQLDSVRIVDFRFDDLVFTRGK